MAGDGRTSGSAARSVALAKISQRPCCEIERRPTGVAVGELGDVVVGGRRRVRRQHSDGVASLVDDVVAVGGDRRAGGVVDEDLRGAGHQVDADHERNDRRRSADHGEVERRRLEHHERAVRGDRRRRGIGRAGVAGRRRRDRFGIDVGREARPEVHVGGGGLERILDQGRRRRPPWCRRPTRRRRRRSRSAWRRHAVASNDVGEFMGAVGRRAHVAADLGSRRPHDRRTVERQRRCALRTGRRTTRGHVEDVDNAADRQRGRGRSGATIDDGEARCAVRAAPSRRPHIRCR